MDILPVFNISTERMSAADAFASCQIASRDMFTIARITDDPFEVDFDAWHLGTIMVGRFRASQLAFDRSPALVASGGLDHLLVQLYVEGGFSGVADAMPISVTPGQIVIFDLTRTLRTEAVAFRNISLLIPRAFFEADFDDASALHGLVLPATSALAGVLASYLTALAERMAMLGPAEATAAARATAALAISVLGGFDRVGRAQSTGILSPFRTIAREIERRLHDPALDIEAIAAATGMSRATLYRAFEPVGGIADYIRRRRLSGAAVALAARENRRRKVADIAHEWGFTHEASFARAFRATFGLTPGAARERSAALWSIPGGDTAGVDAGEFARWMRLLR